MTYIKLYIQRTGYVEYVGTLFDVEVEDVTEVEKEYVFKVADKTHLMLKGGYSESATGEKREHEFIIGLKR